MKDKGAAAWKAMAFGLFALVGVFRTCTPALAQDTSSELAGEKQVPLTDTELEWLADHKSIRLGVDPAYPPFDFVDEHGRHTGMGADYMALIAERLGVNMIAVPDLTWNEVLDGAKKKEIDVLPAAANTQDRKAYLNFTRPYIRMPIVIMGRNDHPPVAGLSDLKGRTVVVVKGYYYVDEISREYPEIKQQIAVLEPSQRIENLILRLQASLCSLRFTEDVFRLS